MYKNWPFGGETTEVLKVLFPTDPLGTTFKVADTLGTTFNVADQIS